MTTSAQDADSCETQLNNNAQIWKHPPRKALKPWAPPPPAIPSSYVLVSKAGNGMYADAFFCLPKKAVQEAVSNVAESFPLSADRLKRELLVVKVFRDGSSPPLSEVAILEQIKQQCKAGVPNMPFIEILGSEALSIAPWIAMLTLPISCDLEALASSFGKMPQEFTWIVYTQLQRALSFLRKCDPPIMHNDIHPGNVIVGYETVEGTCLPQVKLIDFGSSSHSASIFSTSTFDVEAWQLLQILEKLLRRPGAICSSCDFNGFFMGDSGGPLCPSKLCRFHKKVAEHLAPTAVCDFSILDRLWERFGSYAENMVESCGTASQARIREVILEVTQAPRMVTDARIQQICNEAEKAADSTCWPQ